MQAKSELDKATKVELLNENPIWDALVKEFGNPFKPVQPSKRARHKSNKTAQKISDEVWERISNGANAAGS